MIDVARLAQDVHRYVKNQTDQQMWLGKLAAWEVLAQPTTNSEALTVHLNRRVHRDEFSPYVVHPTVLHAIHQRERKKAQEKQRLETDIVQRLKPLLKQRSQASLSSVGGGGSVPLKPNSGSKKNNQSGGPKKP